MMSKTSTRSLNQPSIKQEQGRVAHINLHWRDGPVLIHPPEGATKDCCIRYDSMIVRNRYQIYPWNVSFVIKFAQAFCKQSLVLNMTVNDTLTTILLWFTYQMACRQRLLWAISIAMPETFCSIMFSCLIIPGGSRDYEDSIWEHMKWQTSEVSI